MKRALLIGGLFIFLGCSLGPILVTIVWHLLHGNIVMCADREISVPLRWYPSVESRSVTLVKLPISIYTAHIFRAWIYLSPLSEPPQTRAEIEEAYKNFAIVYRTQLASDGNVIQGPIRIGTAANEAFCMQSFSQNNETWFEDSCMFFQGTWRADFQGGKNDREAFYKIILGSPR